MAFMIGVVSIVHSELKVLRADTGGAPPVDGVLVQVRLDLRQPPGPGLRHHRAAPAVALPAAAVQQLLWLWLWLRYLYPQLLHCAMGTASTSCCGW